MKKNIFKVSLSTLIFGLVTCLVLSSCSNSEDLADGVTPQNGMEHVSFKISEKDFEPAEEVAGTRAVAQPQTELQDLGDGWQAEVCLVPDTSHREEAKAKTRAISTPTHYTIQAYQGGVLKGQTKGTFNGSTFTPDAGETVSISLPHGTYDFVCFNDKVTANGTKYTVNRADARTARFTIKRGVVINQDPKQYVAFEMKHAGALVSLMIDYVNCNVESMKTYIGTGYNAVTGQYDYDINEAKDPAARLKYTVETDANTIPESMVYDFATDSYSFPTMGRVSPVSFSAHDRNSTRPIQNNPVSNDMQFGDYWLPKSDCASLKLKFTFGEIYGRSLVGKSITVPTHKLVEQNKSYRIIIKLYMGYMYLYSDGTAGPRSKNPGKTPIAVVIDPCSRLAIALGDLKNSDGSPYFKWSDATSAETFSPASNYQQLIMNDMGVNFQPSYTANEYALTAARNYYMTVGYGTMSGTQVGGTYYKDQWNVPNLWQYLELGVDLARMQYRRPNGIIIGHYYDFLVPENAPATGFGGSTPIFPGFDMGRLSNAFTEVGGTPMSGDYWLNSECDFGSECRQAVMSFGGGMSLWFSPKNGIAKIRPVIRY